MNSKTLRGNTRWALRNVVRAYRDLSDLRIAYVRTPSAQHARSMLARIAAAEIRHAAALAQYERFRTMRRYSWEAAPASCT